MTLICVPVCEKNVDALESACERASEWADVIELRLDCLLDAPAANVERISRPVILTFRPAEQGGYRALDAEARGSFWKDVSTRDTSALWDLEGDLALSFEPDWSRVIVSHHDFSGVPANLNQLYDRLAATPARVVKIAMRANDIVDCIPIFQLLERGQSEGREIIAIAMGAPGIATRILGPSRGAFLTYGALEDESATAPGQITARELRSVYHVDKIDRETMVCGLVGRPIMHSVSPHMHNSAFAAAGINGVYLPLEVRDVKTFFKRMVHPRTREIEWNLGGLSITAPHKSNVLECLDWIDPKAKEIGAVNTVVVENNRLLGYNTDAAGFIEPLLRIMDSLANVRVAVIGAGGAARAAVWALRQQQATVTLFARDVSKARTLAQLFDVSYNSLTSASFAEYDLVINATPLGSGDFIDETPATSEQLAGARCVYDLVYNPIETRLLQEARKAGCEVLGGLEMLVAQAKIQFELWTGQIPSSSLMYDAAAAVLDQ
jgi:3-dehydroquinate dehydratase/shikimate dehydrogenase